MRTGRPGSRDHGGFRCDVVHWQRSNCSDRIASVKLQRSNCSGQIAASNCSGRVAALKLQRPSCSGPTAIRVTSCRSCQTSGQERSAVSESAASRRLASGRLAMVGAHRADLNSAWTGRPQRLRLRDSDRAPAPYVHHLQGRGAGASARECAQSSLISERQISDASGGPISAQEALSVTARRGRQRTC